VGKKKYSGTMLEGKLVLVSVMYSPNARMRWGSAHNVASCSREEMPFSRASWTLVRAGQVRMTCWNVSGPVPHHGQVGSGFSSDQEGWVAR